MCFFEIKKIKVHVLISLLFVFPFYSTDALSFDDSWQEEFKKYSGMNTSCSASCHSLDLRSSLEIADFDVPNNAQSAEIELNIRNNHRFFARFRVDNELINDSKQLKTGSNLNSDVELDLSVTAKSSIPVDYCLAERRILTTDDDIRGLYCDKFTITRLPPVNNAPTVSFTPSGPLTIVQTENIFVGPNIIIVPPTVTIPGVVQPIVTGLSPNSSFQNQIAESEIPKQVDVSVSVFDEDPASIVVETTATNSLLFTEPQRTVFSDRVTFQYTLYSGVLGAANFSVKATDNKGKTESRSASVSVIEDTTIVIPKYSVEPSGEVSLTEGNSASVKVLASHPDLPGISYSIAQQNSDIASAAIATVSSENDVVAVSITGIAEGNTEIWVSIDHSDGGIDTAVIPVTVVKPAPVNLPPVANPDVLVFTYLKPTQTINVVANDTDPEGQMLVVSLSSDSSLNGGTLSAQGGNVIYTPPENWSNQDQFNYQAKDPKGLVSSEVVVSVKGSDADGDGVFDNIDNCIQLANPDQTNMDSDLFGDLCDIDPDDDGVLGISGQEFASGKSLVDAQCATCHLTGLSGAPKLDDQSTWDARLATSGGLDALVNSVVQGKGTMRAFGSEYSTLELTQAVRYMAGLENLPPPVVKDIDSDGVEDAGDNCRAVSNTLQIDSDGNGVGDACEPLADSDGDGYPFSLDDDDANAKRLLSSTLLSSVGFFISDNDLSLGSLALIAAKSSGFSRAGIEISETEFISAATSLVPGVDPVIDAELSGSFGIYNFMVKNGSEAGSSVIIQLPNDLPLRSQLKIYNMNSGLWSEFDTNAGDNLSSAQLVGSSCPSLISSNFQNGLAPGLRCVKLRILDGSMNDADVQNNGTIEFIGRIGSTPINSHNLNNDQTTSVDLSPSKGGGSMQSIWLFVLLVWSIFLYLIRASSRTGTKR